MTINTSALSSTLQSKVDALDAATETKEVLLLSKALDAAAGSISVNDVLAEGVVQSNNVNTLGATKIAEINTVATNTFKTVGGTSILGSGDIATLPSQTGASGKVLKSDGTNAAWGTDEKGKILQVVSSTNVTHSSKTIGTSDTLVGSGSDFVLSITPVASNSWMRVDARWFGEASGTWDLKFNIHKDGARVNAGNNDVRHGLSVATSSHGHGDDGSTPEIVHLTTIDKGTTTAGVPISYSLVVSASSSSTMWTNRCFNNNDNGTETGTSEIIITEIGA